MVVRDPGFVFSLADSTPTTVSLKKKTGDICTIKWMFGIPEILDFLRSHKIEEGSTIQVIQKMDGGLILGMDGKRIALCDEAADRIQV